MEEGFNKFENSPGIVLSLQESMDVNNDKKQETGPNPWADSMDNIETDPLDFQSRKCDQENTTAERQDKGCE